MNYPEVYEHLYGSFTADFPSLKRFVDQCPPGPILEIGAGTGRTLNAGLGRDLILLEPSEGMRTTLISKARKFPNVQVISGHSDAIPRAEASVGGVIFAFGSIAEMSPLIFALSEAGRVLREGGGLYILVANPDGYKTAALGIRRAQAKNIAGASVSVETYPLKALGSHEFQTMVTLRRPGAREQHIISQIFPPIENWRDLLSRTGFAITATHGDLDEGPFDQERSPLMVIQAKKTALPVRVATIPNAAVAERVYDSIAAKYSGFVRSAKYGVTDWLKQQALLYRDSHPLILDLACGDGLTGRVLKEMAITPSALYGLDLSAAMVRACRDERLYTSVAQYDLAGGLPASKALQFDIITAFGLLEFIPDCAALMRDVYRSLELGGEVWLSFEAALNESLQTVIKVGDESLTRHARSEDEVRSIVSKSGLELVSCEKRLGYVSPTTSQEIAYFLIRARKTALE